MKTPVVVIIPAAGEGRRFGADKSFFALQGEPVVYWALQRFNNIEEVTEIIPVVRKSNLEKMKSLVQKKSLTKIKRFAIGGQERKDSVFNALRLIKDTESIVLVHDGARPLVSTELIYRVLNAIKDSDVDGVVPVVSVRDTIKEVENRIVKKTLPRDRLVSVQTPQGFRFSRLYSAYSAFVNGAFTDDASVVEKAGGRVIVVEGDVKNIKITTKEDIAVAETFLKHYRIT